MKVFKKQFFEIIRIPDSTTFSLLSVYLLFLGRISHTRGVGVIPNQCPASRPDRDAGLCYPNCRSGYRGVGKTSFTACARMSRMSHGAVQNHKISHGGKYLGIKHQENQ